MSQNKTSVFLIFIVMTFFALAFQNCGGGFQPFTSSSQSDSTSSPLPTENSSNLQTENKLNRVLAFHNFSVNKDSTGGYVISDSFPGGIAKVDLSIGTFEAIPSLESAPKKQRRYSNWVIFHEEAVAYTDTNSVIERINLSTGEIQEILDITKLNLRPLEESSIQSLAVTSDQSKAYFAFRYYDGPIYSVDLETLEVKALPLTGIEYERIHNLQLSPDDSKLYALVENESPTYGESIVSVDLQNEQSSSVADIESSLYFRGTRLKFQISSDSNSAVVIGDSSRLLRVHLQTGELSWISTRESYAYGAPHGSGPQWSYNGGLSVDSDFQFAYTTDIDSGQLFKIHLSTGVRQVLPMLSGRERGSGPKLESVAQVIYTNHDSKALVIDYSWEDRFNTLEEIARGLRVIEVDLQTGDRQEVFSQNRLQEADQVLPYSSYAPGAWFNSTFRYCESRNSIFVGNSAGLTEIFLNDNSSRQVPHSLSDDYMPMDIVLTPSCDYAYYLKRAAGHPYDGEIYKLNLSTGDATQLGSTFSVPSSDLYRVITGLSLSSDGSSLILNASQSVHQIDLSSGDSEMIHLFDFTEWKERYPASAYLESSICNIHNSRCWALNINYDDFLVEVDLSTGVQSTFEDVPRFLYYDLRADEQKIIFPDISAIVEFDLETKELQILSH